MIPFSRPEIGNEEIDAVIEVMKSGWLTTGKEAAAFEADFTIHLGEAISSIAVNSATAGLHLVLEGLGIGPGDEVIVPTWTFTATAEVIEYLGATPVLVDIDEETLLADPKAVSKAITERTKAFIIVHFAGLSADVEMYRKVVGDEISIIEDAAHAFPSAHGAQVVGLCDFSDATVFSFYANKTMTTGEGGMVTTRNEALADRIRIMRLHGIDRDVFDRYKSTKPSWTYDIVAAGYKYNLTDLAAAIGRQQLKKVENMRNRREEIAIQYLEAFKDLELTLPPFPSTSDVHAWHLFTVRLQDTAMSRDEFIARLSERGIGSSVHFIPLHKMTHWKKLQSASNNFQKADAAFERIVSLPLFSKMTDDEIERVIETVSEILEN